MYTQKPSIKQSLLGMFGQIQIGPNEVGIVLQDDRFGRFLKSGGHLPLNPIHERLVKRFEIQVRTVQDTIIVPSADCFEFEANFTVQYIFDPSQAARRHQSEMAVIALSFRPDKVLRNKVKKAAISELRRQIAQYNGEELMRGGIYEEIEKRVHRYLHRGLTDYGISLNMPNSVYLESLNPPADLMQTMQMIHRQKQIAQMLEAYPQVGIQAMQLDILAQQDETVHHTYGIWPLESNGSKEEATPDVQAIILPQSLANGSLRRHAN